MKKSAKNTNNACACGSGKPFAECCQPILDGGVRAATAEQLMRSRYCAYSLHRIDYLRASWHADTCPDDLDEREMAQVKWQELRILDCQAGGVDDNSGTVTFRARFKINAICRKPAALCGKTGTGSILTATSQKPERRKSPAFGVMAFK